MAELGRPRNYGEPTDRGFEIAMDKQTDAIACSRTVFGAKWRQWYIDSVMKVSEGGEDWETSDASARKWLETAYADADEGLPRANPIYVTSDIVTLIEVARETLPAAGPLETDLIVPDGFVWFERPIPNFWNDVPLIGFAWLQPRRLAAEKPVVILCGYGAAGTEAAPKQVSFLDLPDETHVAGDDLATLAATFWLLSEHKVVVTESAVPQRAVRRRAKGREIQSVVVVTLQRKVYAESEGSRKVDWTHRWLVGAHWRQQWYPSEGRHKPVWIMGYVKGPDDKPFVAKRRAFEFNR